MNDIIQISSKKFLIGCALLGGVLFAISPFYIVPSSVIAAEVLLAVIGLFVFGSTRYQLDKNALTYGAFIVVSSSYVPGWWPSSALKVSYLEEGPKAFLHFIHHHLLTLHGLDNLIHADTMLFILGLTFFVSAIAQTRLLESLSFKVLNKNKGAVLPTVAFLTAIVAFASGILDGVSMIGLMIRTLVIILFLAKAKENAIKFAVIISTVITTVCGMWLAYGEPPNLIMKANLHPHLTNSFFLRYCLPVAIGSYLIVYWNLRKMLKGQKVNIQHLDILDKHTADVRFMQAEKHGEVLIPVEFIDDFKEELGAHFDSITNRLHKGVPLGEALLLEKVSPEIRKKLMAEFTSRDLSEPLEEHYQALIEKETLSDEKITNKIEAVLEKEQIKRLGTQRWGIFSFLPFIALLIWHGIDHSVPLFWASFTGFAVAFIGLLPYKKIKLLVLREALHEYREYLFLFPLFFSITLLQKSGFFDVLVTLMNHGIEHIGVALVALIQFGGAVFLSAALDNNVVADFASRALHGLELSILHLFAMAQIAGYAVGGCWTHIGSAQSVVSYAFIKKEVDEKFSPFDWIKLMTPIIIEISILMIAVIYAEHMFLKN